VPSKGMGSNGSVVAWSMHSGPRVLSKPRPLPLPAVGAPGPEWMASASRRSGIHLFAHAPNRPQVCASEKMGICVHSGSKLVSGWNLTLPLVAACSCAQKACVLQSYAPSPRASQDNAIECDLHSKKDQ
jgi:hypothetical protein